jgi:hypothetical protein
MQSVSVRSKKKRLNKLPYDSEEFLNPLPPKIDWVGFDRNVYHWWIKPNEFKDRDDKLDFMFRNEFDSMPSFDQKRCVRAYKAAIAPRLERAQGHKFSN